jgi:hypothetical protein
VGSTKKFKKYLVQEGEYMISSYVSRFSRSIFTWRQPLTKQPSHLGLPVSDLFIWRKSKDWNTFFELIDVPGLFAEENFSLERIVTIIFFDLDGHKIIDKKISLISNKRQTVDIGNLIGNTNVEIGTFAVFHADIPKKINDLGSYLTERGYVSYLYKNSPLRNYVHGNLDAIALSTNEKIEFLGGWGFFSRSYFLQHELSGPAVYEFALVNPTYKIIKIILNKIQYPDGKAVMSKTILLNPGGAEIITYEIDRLQNFRIQVKSQLVMARPLVFRIQDSKLDVFHG